MKQICIFSYLLLAASLELAWLSDARGAGDTSANASAMLESEAVSRPHDNNAPRLEQRSKAIARLYSVGVYCFPVGQEFEWHRLHEEAVQERAAAVPLSGFSTIVDDDGFGYSPGRATDNLTDQIFLENMKWFPEIGSLSLISTDLTDQGIRALERLPCLRSFRLLHLYPPVHPCLITDEGMRTLAACSSLRELRFLGVKLTDAGVEHLSRLPHLERIEIEATFVTPNCLSHLLRAPKLAGICIAGNRTVSGNLSYRDIADYDRLSRPLDPDAAVTMTTATGVPKKARITGTLVVDPSVFEGLCKAPCVEQIEIDSYAHWGSASALAALNGQEHVKYVRCFPTWNGMADAIQVLEHVENRSVRLAVPGRVLTIPEWLNWAQEKNRISVR